MGKSRYLAGAILVALVTAACSNAKPGWVSYVETEPPTPIPDTSIEPPGPGPKGPAPQLGATVTQADAPPPLSGGTLLVTQDGTRLVAADPDRDQVYIVTLADRSVITVPLQAHDEPGRLVEDASGRVHVVLRRGGSIASIDLATGALLSRRAMCAAPRGIAFDPTGAGRLLVACEGGEVMQALSKADAAPTMLSKLDRDLRDIVVAGDRIFVSRFRAVETIQLDRTGAIVNRSSLGDVNGGAPTLAWRMLPPPPDAGNAPMIVHQAATSQQVSPSPGGYGSPPTSDGNGTIDVDSTSGGSIVSSFVTSDFGTVALPTQAVLPVDFVFDGTTLAVVAAGNGHTKSLPQVFLTNKIGGRAVHLDVKGQATSIALLSTTAEAPVKYAVFSREPAQIELLPTGGIIPLSMISREDTGHAIFHSNSGSGLACASCHGEGRDDGHVWNFDSIGNRRTPSMLGTLNGTAPYHWDGDQADLPALVDNVMTGRMNGPFIEPDQKTALQSWLFALPGPIAPAVSDAAAVERGRVLFTSNAVGCSSCHAGERFTSPGSFDVGTDGTFQVPSLIGVGARAPYLHDGLAATLTDRFSPAIGGGDHHGKTSQLSSAQIADIVTYLGTL